MSETDRLIAWMQKRGLKQVDLARLMSISESSISLIINKHRKPGNSFAGLFAKTFSPLDFAEVFGDGQTADSLPYPEATA